MAKIYAKRIKQGKMSIDEVPNLWREETRIIYKELYDEDL